MFSLSIIHLFVFFSFLTKIKYSLQASINIPNEIFFTIDDVDHFNATLDVPVLSKYIGFNIQLNPSGAAYVAPLIVDGQKFNVIFDTGSSNVVVLGADCVTCGNLHKYQPGANKPTGPAVTLDFVSGPAVGVPYAGKVSINSGLSYIQSLPFISASSVPNVLVQNNVEGIVGMSVGPTSASTNTQPFYYTLFDEQKGLDRLFAYSLSAAGGTLTIGADKPGQDVSKINKLTVIGDSYWKVGLGSVIIAANKDGKNYATVKSVLFDTGASTIGAPTTDAFNLFNAIPGSGLSDDLSYWTVLCKTMPDIAFIFSDDSEPFVVPGKNLERPIPGDDTNCRALITPSEALDSIKAWQLGTLFLKTVYSRFTVGAPGSASFVGLVRVPV